MTATPGIGLPNGSETCTTSGWAARSHRRRSDPRPLTAMIPLAVLRQCGQCECRPSRSALRRHRWPAPRPSGLLDGCPAPPDRGVAVRVGGRRVGRDRRTGRRHRSARRPRWLPRPAAPRVSTPRPERLRQRLAHAAVLPVALHHGYRAGSPAPGAADRRRRRTAPRPSSAIIRAPRSSHLVSCDSVAWTRA